MHIAFSSDDNYAQHLGVTVTALLGHLASHIVPQIYVIDGGISQENKARLEQLKHIREFSLIYLQVDTGIFVDFPIEPSSHYTIASYFRLALPQLLPMVDKILYMDVDVVIKDDLLPLYATQLTDHDWLAAVFEPDADTIYMQSVGLACGDGYFNAGIMVINLAALRDFNFLQRCQDYVERFKQHMRYLDQDILNHVCRGHVKPLAPRYNLVANFYGRPESMASIYNVETLQSAVTNPAIVHFVGRRKPWHYRCHLPHAPQYMRDIRKTPWFSYQYPDRTLANMLSRYLYRLRHRH